ncbi:cation-transporting ATPase [Spiroplasma corruscae]|uniref:Cation-transporting ATPase n=1 Tax=Spiroplasma corruscae TaxID=216934 RepID=A0A222EPY0_9MOLU|nr:cation-translocating P-type ATPase [Spiroplasma corruscae]ASP28334.1 cation-transporting ATPase [Spiroplasma corruscae]
MEEKVIIDEDLEWYQLSNDALFERLEVNPEKGLSKDQVLKKREIFGENILPSSKKPSILLIFFKTFLDPLSLIMIVAGVLSLIISLVVGKLTAPDIVGLIIIAFIVIINSIIATVQEVKSQNYVSSLDSKEKKVILVLRDSVKKEIPIEQLVPGDIIYVKAGDFVPADIRIIENQLALIDESALTGENEPVLKDDEAITSNNLVLGDQKNIAFMSTLVMEGKLLGVVFGTGKDSQIGKIATNITTSNKEKTPLEAKVIRLTTIIGIISLILGLILFGLSWLFKDNLDEGVRSWNRLMLIAVSAAISVIPESLTIIVKICLMVATKKMARKNVLIKNPKSIETLGNINVICTDKTGTLTQNKMSVDKVFYNFKETLVNEVDLENNKEFFNCIALCSDAVISKKKLGSPTELASIELAIKAKCNYKKLRKDYKRIDEIPFDSKRKMMTTLNLIDDKKFVYSKGALDYVLKNCSYKLIDGVKTKLTEEDKKVIINTIENFASQGLRLLGLAYKEKTMPKERYEKDLIFLGALGIIDPPRPEVKEAVEIARNAGIRVIMITGDHKITAHVIASRLGIVDDEHNDVITGQEIEELSDEDLKIKLKTTNVFARVNPEHKALIVDCLQSEKNIVAMTGDGVNDSPSLVKADVGIAMGINGSGVAKEVSDVILSDDNFKSIISGVNSGRNVYEKIKYSISFLIAANISQIITILLILAIEKDLALSSVNILFHIFIVETIIAIPIGMGKERKGVMNNKPPLNKKESVLKGIILQITLTTLFNSIFAFLNYQLTFLILDTTNPYRADFAKTGVYIAIIFGPIFYALLYNDTFLPISLRIKTAKKDKFKLNYYLISFMFLAIITTVITLLPIEKLNAFFEFRTENMPYYLWLLFFLFSFVQLPFIYFGYNLLKKTISYYSKNKSAIKSQ